MCQSVSQCFRYSSRAGYPGYAQISKATVSLRLQFSWKETLVFSRPSSRYSRHPHPPQGQPHCYGGPVVQHGTQSSSLLLTHGRKVLYIIIRWPRWPPAFPPRHTRVYRRGASRLGRSSRFFGRKHTTRRRSLLCTPSLFVPPAPARGLNFARYDVRRVFWDA